MRTPLILIADDEASIRRMFGRALQRWGYRVLEAENGDQALGLVRAEDPDLLLLDLRMPHTDGFEVLQRLDPLLRELPVIVISGNAEIKDALEALRSGAYDFLLKPLDDLNILRHTIERALNWRTLTQQSRHYQQQLEADVAERTAELHALSQHLERVREEEKRHIAKEVHDELGVTLTALSMDVSWLQQNLPANNDSLMHKVADMKALLAEAVQTSRRIISDLRPSVLDNLGLIAALEWQAKSFSDRYAIDCQVRSDGDDEALSEDSRITLFRIFQEALTNTAKHADADEIRAVLLLQPERAILSIHDNGCGFDPNNVALTSHGLRGIRERVRQRRGEFEIESSPGAGTGITVSLALQPEEQRA
ncbi:ATP-binding response regulator [Motiliproteus sediminis]|uniref:ATP-binding response regulator n=1 Tax=Motiliproteus sediminis TaxID=1468178 RepID=UPI001AEF6B38|nr:response regulator [Motiliproteus sediminis]